MAGDERIQVVSDLHLELCQQYDTFTVPTTGAPYLVLAGDIGRLADYDLLLGFLSNLVEAYRRVFYVLGNHEFFTLSYEQAIDQARRLEKEPSLKGKVTLLHKTRWDSDVDDDDGDSSRFTILGCTLWSRIVPEARDSVVGRVKDYKRIEGWSVDKYCSLHEKEAVWLREQMAAIRQERVSGSQPQPRRTVVIVTHHAPTMEGTSDPRHAANLWTSAFSTELILAPEAVEAGTWQGVSTWVFGHTHYTNSFLCAGIRVVANQRGYVMPSRPAGAEAGRAGEDLGHVFDPATTIPIHPR